MFQWNYVKAVFFLRTWVIFKIISKLPKNSTYSKMNKLYLHNYCITANLTYHLKSCTKKTLQKFLNLKTVFRNYGHFIIFNDIYVFNIYEFNDFCLYLSCFLLLIYMALLTRLICYFSVIWNFLIIITANLMNCRFLHWCSKIVIENKPISTRFIWKLWTVQLTKRI